MASKEESFREREDVLRWEDYFMGIAFLSGQRSKDPITQVGACIVNEHKRICGTGYNGMPDGCSDYDLFWDSDGKQLYVCHAEMNAILNKNSTDVRGCTMYTSVFPCNECAKMIIQAGIKKVVYYSDKKKENEKYKAAKNMFNLADIKHEYVFKGQHIPKKPINIDFTEMDRVEDGTNSRDDPGQGENNPKRRKGNERK